MMTIASDAAIERADSIVETAIKGVNENHLLGHATLAFADQIQQFSDAIRAHFGSEVPASLAGYVLPVPVDPMRDEAIELVLTDNVARTANQVDAIRQGKAGQQQVELAIRALKRGAELRIIRAIAAQGGDA
jgi:hypothetical protein